MSNPAQPVSADFLMLISQALAELSGELCRQWDSILLCGPQGLPRVYLLDPQATLCPYFPASDILRRLGVLILASDLNPRRAFWRLDFHICINGYKTQVAPEMDNA